MVIEELKPSKRVRENRWLAVLEDGSIFAGEQNPKSRILPSTAGASTRRRTGSRRPLKRRIFAPHPCGCDRYARSRKCC